MSAYAEHPVAGVALLLWACSPEQAGLCATPLYAALAARALELPVEVYCTAGSVRLLQRGVAEGLRPSPRHDKTLHQLLREAHEAGVQLYACSTALAVQGVSAGDLIAECAGHGGLLQYMARAADARWRCLVF